MQASHHRQIGATLVECCIVMVIAVVLLGTAVPSFQETLQRRALEAVAADLAADVMYTRSEAVSRNQNISITFGGSANRCYVIHTGAPSDCSCTDNGVAACIAGAEPVKTVVVPDDRAIRLHSNVASMRFNADHGTVTPTATLRVSMDNGPEIRQIINIMGRPRACAVGRIAGYKPCA